MNDVLIAKLVSICGQANVLWLEDLITPYLTDWRERYHGNAIAVAFPTTSKQVSEIITFCQKEKIAIIPQGGNTSTCGAATPLAEYERPQIILNLAHMNKIISIDMQNYSMEVEAGCTLQQIQEYALKHGLYFPLSLASEGSCQIGGNIATNAGGVQVIKYGMMRNLTLGIEVVLANGEILDEMQSLTKDNTYLDLKQFFIGSEGTLGIITKASLRLYPLPQNHTTFLLAIKNLDTALNLLHKLQLTFNNSVSAFEIISKDSQQIYNQHFPDKKLPLSGEWLTLVELETSLDFDIEQLSNCIMKCMTGMDNCIIANNEMEQQKLWQIREHIPLAEKKHGYAAKHDVSLPLSKISQFLETNMPKLKELEPNGYFSIFGHLGDGNLHYNFGIPNSGKDEVTRLENLISPTVYQDVVKFGGSIAAEHGIGQTKAALLKKFSSKTKYSLLQNIKKTLDPDNLFNPDKIIHSRTK